MPDTTQVKVILHATVSLDGSFVGFDLPPELMGLHYEIAARFEPAIRLIGSNTARVAMEMFGGFQPEKPEDLRKPEKPDDAAPWVFVDSKGILEGKLHYFRNSEYCGQVGVLVAAGTPASYLDYLRSRNYDFFVSAEDRVNLRQALDWMAARYDRCNVLTDTGGSLAGAMLNAGLVHEISLLTIPLIVGRGGSNLFAQVTGPLKLSLCQQEALSGGCVWSLYQVGDRR